MMTCAASANCAPTCAVKWTPRSVSETATHQAATRARRHDQRSGHRRAGTEPRHAQALTLIIGDHQDSAPRAYQRQAPELRMELLTRWRRHRASSCARCARWVRRCARRARHSCCLACGVPPSRRRRRVALLPQCARGLVRGAPASPGRASGGGAAHARHGATRAAAARAGAARVWRLARFNLAQTLGVAAGSAAGSGRRRRGGDERRPGLRIGAIRGGRDAGPGTARFSVRWGWSRGDQTSSRTTDGGQFLLQERGGRHQAQVDVAGLAGLQLA